jgi:RNA-directed DNA polymerase
MLLTTLALAAAAVGVRYLVKALEKREARQLPPATPQTSRGDQVIAEQVQLAVTRRMAQQASFTTLDIVHEVVSEEGPQRNPKIFAASLAVERLQSSGFFSRNGYERTNLVFHPTGKAPTVVPSRPPAAGSRPVPVYTAPVAPTRSAAPPRPSNEKAYVATDILGLSEEEFRKRALKINPWQSAAIGRRMDVIPPQTDERTALIDRGLILRGLLTEAQILDMHRVGDLWLRHRDAARYAEAAARETADAAMQAQKQAAIEAKAEKKRLAEQRRIAHRATVAKRHKEDIIFLGRGVSAKIHDRRANIEMLEKLGLPIMATPADVALKLGISIAELRWLAFHAEATTRPHYVYFEIKKRSGGTRLLAAPHEKLGKAQRWILQNVLMALQLTELAHGFVKGRSTVTNARQHVGQSVVVNFDLKDFFPTIVFSRVRGLFQSVGYSPAVATVLALLSTESPRSKVMHDGTAYWVAAGERCLPQGACTSPMLSNLIARKLDRRIAGVTSKLGWKFTRYADDLTMSGAEPVKARMGKVLASVRAIARDEGFAINERKGRVQRSGGRQDVTGIGVNQKLGLPRAEVRRLRAILHAAQKSGLESQNRKAHPHFRSYLEGKIGYLMMVDPVKGKVMRDALDKVAG